MKLSTILDQIDLGSIALPEFQRGYVWNRDQVRKLMHSLYLGYPVGSLLVWETKTETANTRGDGPLTAGYVKLLLDGQQRITSLYGIIRGRPPKFFDGDKNAFTGLYFNLEKQEFEFYAPVKMKDNPLWINVTELMQMGAGEFVGNLYENPNLLPQAKNYLAYLNKIDSIKDRAFHVEDITGEDKTVEVVVNIFNEVNSGGTKLSQGDLALARVCASWADARDELKVRLTKWEKAGFYFKLDWFLRSITTVTTGQAYYSALKDKDIEPKNFVEGIKKTEKYTDFLLNLIASRLGLDHDRVLGSRYSFPLLVRYLEQRNGVLSDYRERDKLLYWYIHSFLWGRYAGSTESTIAKDLAVITENEGALDRLIEQLHQNRGDLRLYSRDFESSNKSSRFYPLLYMLTRVWHARDWESGVELTNHLLGKLSSLQVHHIFPKAMLYRHNYNQAEANAIANFTFLTQETNLRVSDNDPAIYLERFASRNPGVIESHWIPMDRNLWKTENYRDFLAARRDLLAKAANDLLDNLLAGSVPESQSTTPILDRELVIIPGGVDSEDEQSILNECNGWLAQYYLEQGEYRYELTDEATGQSLAYLDLAWPDGIQVGKSEPVALLLDEGQETIEAANRKGYRCFRDFDSFKTYVLKEILVVEDENIT